MDWLISRTPARMARPTFTGPRTLRFRSEPQPGGAGGGEPAGGAGGGAGAGGGGQGDPDPAPGGGGGQGGAGGAGGAGDPAPENEAAAARRIADREKKRADDLERQLKEKNDAELSEKERAEQKAADAEQRATAAEEKAKKAERRVLVREAATAAKLNPDVVADLSESQLLEGDEFDAKAAEKLVADTKTKYSLQPTGGEPTPTPFGQPAGEGAGGAGGSGNQGSGDPGATGDPKKDYRKGIGRGILDIVRRGGGVPESQGGRENDDD